MHRRTNARLQTIIILLLVSSSMLVRKYSHSGSSSNSDGDSNYEAIWRLFQFDRKHNWTLAPICDTHVQWKNYRPFYFRYLSEQLEHCFFFFLVFSTNCEKLVDHTDSGSKNPNNWFKVSKRLQLVCSEWNCKIFRAPTRAELQKIILHNCWWNRFQMSQPPPPHNVCSKVIATVWTSYAECIRMGRHTI